MVFLTLAECQSFLLTEFSEVAPELAQGLTLQSHQLADSVIQQAEYALNLGKLPTNFTGLLQRYNFENFSILNIHFGSQCIGYLDWLLAINDPKAFGFKAFTSELRQHFLLVIANGDPFAILLDSKTGFITALSSEESIAARLPVAPSFQRFIEGMGTAYKAARHHELAAFLELVRKEFGEAALPFWEQVSDL